MASNETEQHRELKRLALEWAKEQGFSCAACEIRLPHSGFRADVAAYKPAFEKVAIEFEGRILHRREPVIGCTALFECKQSRSDMLKDSFLEQKTREQLKRLHERRTVLERLLRIHLPNATIADSLFQEFQTLNPAALDHAGYKKVIRQIAGLQTGLFRKTKFEKLFRYRCANLCYLVTPGRIINKYELPPGWGLLVEKKGLLELTRKPVWQDVTLGAKLGLLQRIALSENKKAGPVSPLTPLTHRQM